MRSICNIPFRFMIALVLLLAAQLSFAQLDTGSISGVVTDSTGAAVRGAAVVVTNTKTAREWKATTGSIGEFTVSPLPVGPYTVTVVEKGFKTSKIENLSLHSTETLRADARLTVGGSAEQVTVVGEANEVNTTTSGSGSTIGGAAVGSLPLNGRDFTALLALVPGSGLRSGFGHNSRGGG